MQALIRSSRWLAVTLSPEGLILSLSPSAEQFVGYSPGELVGRPVTSILDDDTAFEMPKILSTVKEWGYWEGEIAYSARSGDRMVGRGVLTSMFRNGNRVDTFLLLSNLKGVAREEPGKPAVGDIASDLRAFAHDLNNPLAVSMGFAQLLVLDPACKGKIRADLEKLYSELQNVVQIVEKLHSYAVSLQQNSPVSCK